MNRVGTLGARRPLRHVHPLILMACLLAAPGPQSLWAAAPPHLDVAAALAPHVFAVSPETAETKPQPGSAQPKSSVQPTDFFAALADPTGKVDQVADVAPPALRTADFFSILARPQSAGEHTLAHLMGEAVEHDSSSGPVGSLIEHDPQSPGQLVQMAAGRLYSVLEKPSAGNKPEKHAQRSEMETPSSDTPQSMGQASAPASNELQRIPLFGASAGIAPQPADEVVDALDQDSRPMQQLTVNIDPGTVDVPTNHAAQHFEQLEARGQQQAVWDESYGLAYYWAAPGTSHRPLYFEEINLERYGWSHGHFFQPAVSAARFYGTIPALPYLFVAERHCHCQYTLGHYRPGDCTPYQCHYPPFSVAGIFAEGAAATGLVFLIP